MKHKTKIVNVLNSRGGVDVYMRLITKNLDMNKFELVVVHGDEDTDELFTTKNGQQIKEYKLPIEREIHPIQDIKSAIKLIGIIRKEKPDIIHAHSAKGGIIARIAAIFTKAKVLYTPHAFSYLSADSNFKRNLFLWIERVFKYTGNVVLATSPSEAQRAMREVHYKPKNVEVYKNSVEPVNLEELGETTSIDFSEKYLCSIGRPSYQKNIEVMVEVFKKVHQIHPTLKFVLLGVGHYAPSTEKVKTLLQKYQLEEHFIMLPWIPREEIFAIVHKSELYISTSRYEGLPYSIIESLGLGRACVVSDCDGNRDLVQHNYNGYVVSQNEITEKMPEFILSVLNNPEEKKRFEQNSIKLFSEDYNITKTIIDLEKIYEKYSLNSVFQ